jgi:hypothetical protein
MRQCPYCGVPVSKIITQCPACREAIGAASDPNVRTARSTSSPAQKSYVRRGLLYMLLAGVIYYFSAGYSAMQIPVMIASIVTAIFVPLLFLGGLGLTILGLWRG